MEDISNGISNFRGLLLMFQEIQPTHSEFEFKEGCPPQQEKMFRVNLSSQQMKSEIQNPKSFPPFWEDEPTPSVIVTF